MNIMHIALAALMWLGCTTGAAAAELEAHTPSVKETMAAVGQISHELKQIDARLGKIEQSISSIDASLAPVGSLAQPGALRGLILLATACAAGLIVLHAALRRWMAAPRQN
jgi:hypothetical protein